MRINVVFMQGEDQHVKVYNLFNSNSPKVGEHGELEFWITGSSPRKVVYAPGTWISWEHGS